MSGLITETLFPRAKRVINRMKNSTFISKQRRKKPRHLGNAEVQNLADEDKIMHKVKQPD
jgi:hypothetical protein